VQYVGFALCKRPTEASVNRCALSRARDQKDWETAGFTDRLGLDRLACWLGHQRSCHSESRSLLVEQQNDDGSWSEDESPAPVPLRFLLEDHLYRNSFPLYRLARLPQPGAEASNFARSHPAGDSAAQRVLAQPHDYSGPWRFPASSKSRRSPACGSRDDVRVLLRPSSHNRAISDLSLDMSPADCRSRFAGARHEGREARLSRRCRYRLWARRSKDIYESTWAAQKIFLAAAKAGVEHSFTLARWPPSQSTARSRQRIHRSAPR